MPLSIRNVLLPFALAAAVTAGCTAEDDPQPPSDRVITIPDLTGLSRAHAIGLIDNLELEIVIERVDPGGIEGASPPSAAIESGPFALDAVLRQDPPPDTKVAPGTTITLFVPHRRSLRPGEDKFRLLSHCGLSYPLEFAGRFWLPVDRKLRRTINPPQGFASDGYYDNGTIRRVDKHTLIYTSSTGIEVEYEPTNNRPGGCE
jgi:hypothetical protein